MSLFRSRWPRTLLWQTFLVVAVVMVMALVAWYQIFRHLQQGPRANDLAQMVVSVVNLTRTALINAEPRRRRELLIDLAALEGIRIYPAEREDEIEPLPDTRPIALLTSAIRRSLGEQTRFASSWEGLEGFWVSFRLDPQDRDEYWVMLPADRVVRPRAVDWLGWGALALAFSLLAAYLIVSRINQPLRGIAEAARAVGRGETPPPLSEKGASDIADVARAFNHMAGDLARLDADRRLILAGVSHDLRTPLARLRLGVEMSPASDEDREAMATDIEEMDRIIGQFVDFGRDGQSESGADLELSAFLAEIHADYIRRGLPLSLHADGEFMIKARPLALRRAMNNLIDNAYRYAGISQGVELRLRRSESRAIIEVLDRGPGIPPEEVERLKRPFTRLETARTDARGSGLGLAIVDRIARGHGGELRLLQRDGGGLQAVIDLPLKGVSIEKTS
ncbi:MAG: ATP-binding protein [Rhodocyclaceae bacterium]|nr:HAMP domain-containing protein [Rhodocyclaceae bacterium]MCB1901708.1 HAMP domain-containing protein [Rhodocyclaceae bacterium]MCP5308941.1 HAMP domain-containing protein [Zoogloeaceae bacterium]